MHSGLGLREKTAEEKALSEVRRMINLAENLRRRAKCKKLKERYARTLEKWRRVEQMILNGKPTSKKGTLTESHPQLP